MKKPKWCRHIIWQPYEKKWWVFLDYLEVESIWKMCPVCGAKRPSRAKKAVAAITSIILLLASTALSADLELSAVFATEIYPSGETKSGAGLRGRAWLGDFGVEAQGLSMTPRDSIVDRSDLSLAWRYQFGERGEACDLNQAPPLARVGQAKGNHSQARSGVYQPPSRSPFSLIASAGYGRNWEDGSGGTGIGASLQWTPRRKWFGEIGVRQVWENHNKQIATIGIGRKL